MTDYKDNLRFQSQTTFDIQPIENKKKDFWYK